MVRTVVASESFLAYLTSFGKSDFCITGLILGQYTTAKDYVIHFAKTPPVSDNNSKTPNSIKTFKSLNDILSHWISDHAKQATRLLPGGMHVLGIFILSNLDPFSGKNLEKIKDIIKDLHKQLKGNEYLFGNYESPEKLVLHYSTGSRSCLCKSIDPITGSVNHAEFKFLSNKVNWLSAECFYELSQVFPIQEKEDDLSLKKHMSKILQTVTNSLKSAVFLFDGETKAIGDYLHKNSKISKSPSSEQEKPVQVTIILPNNCNELKEPLEIRSCAGQIKLSGQVASKIWVSPTMTIGEVSQAIIEDILRSLEARLEMHWDSLIEEEHGSPEDKNSIHEPPRRIFVKIPGSEITLSDYLFPGEGPQEAAISLEELLDITINEKEAISDAEGQADLTEFYTEKMEVESEDNLPKLPTETSKFMYMVGLGIALFVLLVSLLIHYFQNLF